MNKIPLFVILFVLLWGNITMGKVLVVVNNDYYNNSDGRVDRYMEEVTYYDGPNTELVLFDAMPGNDMYAVWDMLSRYYASAVNSGDPVGGAVLIGYIPAPIFCYNNEFIPCEYFYMDLWNWIENRQYDGWNEPWRQWDWYVLDRNVYEGDGILDIWVSRICAENIYSLRNASGTLLEEYEIINNYLDRVHDRMTGPSKVPHRGFCMGPPPQWSCPFQRTFMAMNYMGLNSITYFDYSNRSRMNLNQAAAWQAQLQNGPYGNINYGAFNGQKFTDPNCARDCRVSGADTRGYEWAAVFAHSDPQESSFHCYGGYSLGNVFRNNNTQPLWTKVSSGGYSGAYYTWTNPAGDGHNQAEWSCVVPSYRGGTYRVYMYVKIPSPNTNSPSSYFNLWGGRSFYKIAEGAVNQRTTGSGNWKQITSGSWSQFTCSAGDTLVFSFSPNHLGAEPPQNRCVADAIKFRRNDGYEIIIRTSDIFNINSRGNKGFRLKNWYNRSFCDMQYDGGQSKVPFFLTAACRIANYLNGDNLGLLYAMGHEGLESIGNSYENWDNNDYEPFTQCVGYGYDFGGAYLAQAQDHFALRHFEDNFILFGAGTLQTQPYQPYRY